VACNLQIEERVLLALLELLLECIAFKLACCDLSHPILPILESSWNLCSKPSKPHAKAATTDGQVQNDTRLQPPPSLALG
jgi:hypothetical protein